MFTTPEHHKCEAVIHTESVLLRLPQEGAMNSVQPPQIKHELRVIFLSNLAGFAEVKIAVIK